MSVELAVTVLNASPLPHAEVEAFSCISLSEMDEVSLLNRVDTKYIIARSELPSLLLQIQNGYRVLSHLGQRIHGYRTLYFDTPENAMYLRHHNGFATRMKIRKRWYLGAELAYFEVKRRTNRRRTIKKRIRLTAECETSEVSVFNAVTQPGHHEHGTWLAQYCPYDVASLEPRTWTHFERITLVDLALQERVTIDHHLRFCDANGHMPPAEFEWRSPVHDFCIVEVKRGGSRAQSLVMAALRERHILPASFSKYCIGTALLQPQLKHNRFKPILRSLGGLHI